MDPSDWNWWGCAHLFTTSNLGKFLLLCSVLIIHMLLVPEVSENEGSPLCHHEPIPVDNFPGNASSLEKLEPVL